MLQYTVGDQLTLSPNDEHSFYLGTESCNIDKYSKESEGQHSSDFIRPFGTANMLSFASFIYECLDPAIYCRSLKIPG